MLSSVNMNTGKRERIMKWVVVLDLDKKVKLTKGEWKISDYSVVFDYY